MRTFQELYQDILEQEDRQGQENNRRLQSCAYGLSVASGAVCAGDRSGKLRVLRG